MSSDIVNSIGLILDIIMNCKILAATTGLILDIAGVILLFLFGLPSKVTAHPGLTILYPGADEKKQRAEFLKYQRWARVGLLLLIVGFILQIVALYV